MAVTHVRARDKNCCALAAIESLTADRGPKRYSQADLIEKFPAHCQRDQKNLEGESLEGVIGPLDMIHILRELGFVEHLLMGFGREFGVTHNAQVPDGIFLHTINHLDGKHGGFHCWRVESILQDVCWVVNNDPPPTPHHAPLLKIPWGLFETLGGTLLVCVPLSKPKEG
jgi:hypothetical protein